MKQTFLFYILACMTSLFIFSSCEDNTDQVLKTQPDTTKEITNRTITDCEDCPQTPEHCCCAIEIVEAVEDLELVLCGVSPMTIGSACGPISPPSPCGTISGTSSLITLDPSGPSSALFCVPIGGSFSIFQSSGGPSKLRVTCQAGQLNPQGFQINIDGTTFYFDTNGNCMLAPCE
jgi:hypothetical protein